MLKVQLVFAPASLYSPYEVLAENMWPPLGVLYLASYLHDKIKEVDIKVTDGCRIGYSKTIDEIKKFKPDILGISFFSTQAFGALSLSAEVKRMNKSTLVILGGPHATALPVETLEESKADMVAIGEGEQVFYHVVKEKLENKEKSNYNNIKGLCLIKETHDGKKIINNGAEKFISNLDEIPFPAFDLIDLKKYRGWFLSKQSPESTMFFARGCPYNCTFCSNKVWKSSTPTLRFRSPKNIVDEMEMLYKKYGIREIFDQSDEFNNSLQHAIDICKEIKSRKLNITWKAQLRAIPFNEELAREMSEAGCWYVHLGIESGNQKTINGINKKIELAQVENTCRLLKKYNIKVLALFMLYNVWEEDGKLVYEDTKMSENTLKYAWSLIKRKLVDYISWSVATPYPGSKLYDIAIKHNLLKPEFKNNWEAWQKEELFVMKLPGITHKQQRRIKIKGEIIRAKCMLRNWDFKLKDIKFLIKRAFHTVMTSLRKDK
jgi:anaerobic magnesium-protoporphyrin IX monomethyl ester cyclase